MSFLPEWWSKGTNAYDQSSKFGQAGMFDKPTAQQQGDFGGYLQKLISALRNYGNGMPESTTPDMTTQSDSAPNTNSMPSFTPYQTTPIGPDMGQTNMVRDFGLNPDGSKKILPNFNRTYGGY